MKGLLLASLISLLVIAGVLVAGRLVRETGIPPAVASSCPVHIHRAEQTIARAEKGKLTAESKSLLAEAKKLVSEARAHHEQATAKKDHDEGIRKAKAALGLAEEVIKLQPH
jgi:hypothetical protein